MVSTLDSDGYLRRLEIPDPRPPRVDAFFSPSEDSIFRHTCVLQRLNARPPSPRVLDTSGEWFGALADVFGLRNRVSKAHEAWLGRSA